uniref:Uncharacterized protein n=1 Tax=Amphimedon queenslandica TaxID=400682 RepID=A0A1X7VTG6_AMPQE
MLRRSILKSCSSTESPTESFSIAFSWLLKAVNCHFLLHVQKLQCKEWSH